MRDYAGLCGQNLSYLNDVQLIFPSGKEWCKKMVQKWYKMRCDTENNCLQCFFGPFITQIFSKKSKLCGIPWDYVGRISPLERLAGKLWWGSPCPPHTSLYQTTSGAQSKKNALSSQKCLKKCKKIAFSKLWICDTFISDLGTVFILHCL